MTLDCPKLAKLYTQLQTLKSSFDNDLLHSKKGIESKGIYYARIFIAQAQSKKLEINKIITELQEIMYPFEKLINFTEQYETQKRILTELGDLQKLSTGELGIVGIDKRVYPFPSKSLIRSKLLAKKELFARKIEQGFTRLLITPFALPLERFFINYGEDLKRHFNAKKLFSASPNPLNDRENLESLTLDLDKPVMYKFFDEKGDINGHLKYYPEKFTSKYGTTKTDILALDPSAGFEVTFLSQNPIIPSSPTKLTPRQYLALTQTKDKNSIYYKTNGQTPEGAINLNRQMLHETNQVLGDYFGNDKANYCLAVYDCSDNTISVPIIYWYRATKHAQFRAYKLSAKGSSDSFRATVRVL